MTIIDSKNLPLQEPQQKHVSCTACCDIVSQKYWRHTVLARHATQQNVVGESKNMKHVKIQENFDDLLCSFMDFSNNFSELIINTNRGSMYCTPANWLIILQSSCCWDYQYLRWFALAQILENRFGREIEINLSCLLRRVLKMLATRRGMVFWCWTSLCYCIFIALLARNFIPWYEYEFNVYKVWPVIPKIFFPAHRSINFSIPIHFWTQDV